MCITCTEMMKLSGYVTWEMFEIICSDFQVLHEGGYAYDTDHTKIHNPGTKLINTHTLSVWRVQRYGTLRDG